MSAVANSLEIQRLIAELPYRAGDRVKCVNPEGDLGECIFVIDHVREYRGVGGAWATGDKLTLVMKNGGSRIAPSKVAFVEIPERLRKRGLAVLVERYKKDAT